MAKGPAVVLVARHGARLDASDKKWHLTSPTPYDPPLTYGGWTQGKALGLRIAALLHERDIKRAEGVKNGANADLAHLEFSPLDGSKAPKQTHGEDVPETKHKYKIVIHSSPYLRCIQTSTAIAAGISQFQAPSTTHLKVPHPVKERNGFHGHSPSVRTPTSRSPAVQPAVLEPAADPNLEVFHKQHIGPDKILLRIDAFLGEWLSPDYFEDITPPPNSTMMVAGAKADLLRRGDYIEVQPDVSSSKGHFPGGWVKSNNPSAVNSRKNSQEASFPTMGSLASVLPHRERSSSQGSVALRSSRSRSRERGTPSISTAHKVPDHIYDPPVPSYAVSPAHSIPRGYVAHARDACVEVDYQWDSMRPPQEWGDGGEYGDEWSTMHKRFRKGLAGMMDWYKEHGAMTPKDQIPGFTFRERDHPITHHASDPGPHVNISAEDDEEIVLVLVTHGAGCNALLGAISNQPVLMDVGLAALSMAERREEPRKPSISSIHQRRPSVIDTGMSETYEMKILASIDHLRPGVDPSKPPQAQPQSPAVAPSPSLKYRQRFGTTGGASSPIDSPLSLGEPYRNGWNSSLGSMRRSSTSGSGSRLPSSNLGSASPTIGLWGGLRPNTPESSSDGRKSPGHDFVLNFASQQPKPAPTSTPAAPTLSIPKTEISTVKTTNGSSNAHDDIEEGDEVKPLPTGLGRTNSMSTHGLWGGPKPQVTHQGLWGPPRKDDVYEHGRGPKRRWTVTEREEVVHTN